MLSRREKLLIRPWEEQRYKNHRRKLQSARPAVDVKTPPDYSHITNKLKKLQAEKERLDKIAEENIRLIQRLGVIMNTKRIDNFWSQPRPNFLNRQKINFNRPKTCKGRIETENKQLESVSTSEISKKTYCPTCSGKPIKRNQVIPEERIPWEPPRKSWNVKIHTKEFQTHKCCSNCCKR